MPRDSELLARWCAGESAAGSELFKRYFDALYRFFINKLPEETEDLIQSTWTACVRYAERLEQATNFRAYLFVMAKNELYRAVRRRRDGGLDVDADTLVDLSPSPATYARFAEQDRQLLGALRRLPVEAQVIVELYFWEDLTVAEIATVLALPEGTAKSRLRAAKRRLDDEIGRAVPNGEDSLDKWVRSMRAKLEKDLPRT